MLYGLALRLECLRLASAAAGPTDLDGLGHVPMHLLLPPAIGVIHRPAAGTGVEEELPPLESPYWNHDALKPYAAMLREGVSAAAVTAVMQCGGVQLQSRAAGRHPAENVVVAVPTTNDYLARLCTRTASLLLPVPVTMILDSVIPTIVDMHLLRETDGPPSIIRDATISFRSVTVLPTSDPACPNAFPVLVLNTDSAEVTAREQQLLLAALMEAASYGVEFDTRQFVAECKKRAGVNLRKQVECAVASLNAITGLVVRACETREAIVFKPSDPSNPLCDVVAILPSSVPRAVYLWLGEVRDRADAAFDEKLKLARKSELLLAPLALRLARREYSLAGTVLMPVARAPFVLLRD